MSIGKQNNRSVLPEYTVDNLGTSFKVVLVNSAQRTMGENGPEVFIPDFQGLVKRIAITRAAHPLKLRGQDIRFLRKTLGLKSRDLAEKLDVSPEHLSRCESGEKILSSNSEKVLRTLVLLEAVFVLQKAIEDHGQRNDLSKRLSAILEKLRDVFSGLRISPVHTADEELILHFKLEAQDQKTAANDRGDTKAEWLDEAEMAAKAA